jgi:hypothetical protein
MWWTRVLSKWWDHRKRGSPGESKETTVPVTPVVEVRRIRNSAKTGGVGEAGRMKVNPLPIPAGARQSANRLLTREPEPADNIE